MSVDVKRHDNGVLELLMPTYKINIQPPGPVENVFGTSIKFIVLFL